MKQEIVYVRRKGGTAKGKDWEAFLDQQTAVLNERSGADWELVSAVGVVSAEAMREASKTSGMLLYFRKP